MSLGNFRETGEKPETSEGKEAAENVDKPKNQILRMPEKNEDDFEKKIEASESKENNDKKEDSGNEKDKQEGEKQNIFEKMKDLFSKKDTKEEKENSEEKSDKQPEQSTSKQSWELSPEDLQKVREGQSEVAEKARNGAYDKPKESVSDAGEDEENVESNQKTPWDNATRRMQHER